MERPPREASLERNLVYGMYSGLALLLDVHRPAAPNGLGVVFVGGSGWESAPGWDAPALKDKETQTRGWLPALLAAGYVVFAPNHRAAPRFRWPAPFEDVTRAIRYARSRARDFGVDPDRLGGLGGSSGAHLLCLAALAAPAGRPGASDPVEREDATLSCLVLREAPTDLRDMMEAGDEEGRAYARSLMGGPGEELDAARVEEASPIRHVSPAAPPTLLIHGDADATVPYAESLAMEAALRAAGVPARLLAIPGGLHAPDFGAEGGPRPSWPDYLGEAVAWLDFHLRGTGGDLSAARPQAGGPPAAQAPSAGFSPP